MQPYASHKNQQRSIWVQSKHALKITSQALVMYFGEWLNQNLHLFLPGMIILILVKEWHVGK